MLTGATSELKILLKVTVSFTLVGGIRLPINFNVTV